MQKLPGSVKLICPENLCHIRRRLYSYNCWGGGDDGGRGGGLGYEGIWGGGGGGRDGVDDRASGVGDGELMAVVVGMGNMKFSLALSVRQTKPCVQQGMFGCYYVLDF